MAARLEIHGLSVQYSTGATPALHGVTVGVASGSCCAVLGPTGAGKTTLLHALSGVLGKHHARAIASGSITVADSSFSPLPKTILFPLVGLALQDPYVQISGVRETVYDEVRFTLENLGLSSQGAEQRILPLLKELGIDHLALRKPTALSGGETQRVALATILAARPNVLLLDEPASSLDLTATVRLQRILKSLREKTTVVLTDTHIDFALVVAHQIVVLDRGRVVFDGTPKGFLSALEDLESILPASGWRRVATLIETAKTQPASPHHRLAGRLGIA